MLTFHFEKLSTMKKQLAWAVVILLIIGVSACHKSDLTSNVSNIMFINGCPDSATDLQLQLGSGSVVVPMTGYLANLGYQYVIPGRDSFDVYSSSDSTLLAFSSTLANGGTYSVFTGGLLQKPSVFIVTDNLVTPNSSSSSVRLVNACSDAGAATITGTATSTSGNTVFGSAVAYKTASGFTTLPAGVYTLKVTGTNPANEKDTASVQFNPGMIYTIMYSGASPTYSVTVISNN
jgi:hypothetical protein